MNPDQIQILDFCDHLRFTGVSGFLERTAPIGISELKQNQTPEKQKELDTSVIKPKHLIPLCIGFQALIRMRLQFYHLEVLERSYEAILLV